jgi:hypothetical protein
MRRAGSAVIAAGVLRAFPRPLWMMVISGTGPEDVNTVAASA